MKVHPFLILFLIFFGLAGCVGTIQENSAPQNLEYKNPPTTFSFPGIVSARGISHDKVELEFFPAPGSINEVEYSLYVNNSTFPITIDTKALFALNGGKILYTVTNLQADREYKFVLKARVIKSGSISENENEAFARTFDNVVSDFNGVSRLSLVPGDSDGAVLVDWISAPMYGFPIAGPFDPVNYEITVISEIGGASNLNNPSYGGTDKRVILTPTPPARANPLSNPSSIVIDGLAQDTRYYFQVRAINALYLDYSQNPDITVIPVNKEMNTRYLSIKTDRAGNLFDFDQDNVILTNAPGLDAMDKIDVFWKPGTGSFTGYRIFIKEYSGLSTPSEDDQLNEDALINLNNSNNFTQVSPSLTTRRMSGLTNGSWYQVKVALCKTSSCPLNSTDPNAAIISDLKAIQIKPTLAPFGGINSIEPPGQYSERDVIKLKFDAPLMSQGFATSIEFYCVDPSDKTQMHKFDGTNPITGTSSTCDGLFLSGAAQPISSWKSQIVKGLVSNGTREYCFTSTPVISGYGPDIRLAPNSRIIRCSFPEVKPPTITQFPGINGGCQVSGTSANVEWTLPTGGIYSGFKVFWREKNNSSKFSYPAAISDTANSVYSSSPILAADALNFNLPNLMPGRNYQIGVLAHLDLDPPATDQYSEYNLRVIDCLVPLPIASFKGFSRIFAIGPKVDGRFPNESVNKYYSSESFLYEAINSDGIPYEIAMASQTVPHPTQNYVDPPGHDLGNSLASPFDGAPNSADGNAYSKNGIISLAWEEVPLKFRNGGSLEAFPEADTLFNTNQPSASPKSTTRSWGYKIYRSADNKLSWQELTTTHGLVFSSNFTQLKRPNDSSSSARRMAFFTDYSVKSLSESHDATTGQDIERARTYYYKIVPIFDGKPLTYETTSDHIVRVTLPPPNMALVHRWMSNRAHCLELDKIPLVSSHYSCDYNGIGSKPKGIPYRVGQTKIDQGGDLLVDRQELGCRYTRGDRVDDPLVGGSIFSLTTRRNPDDKNHLPLFNGYRTLDNAIDNQTPFKGCTGGESATRALMSNNYPNNFIASFNHTLVGDCIGGHYEIIANSACTSTQFSNYDFQRNYVTTPGVKAAPTPSQELPTAPDCSDDEPSDPKLFRTKFVGPYASNFLMQSEFMAVFYNTYTPTLNSEAHNVPIQGPSPIGIDQRQDIVTNGDTGVSASQCFINLAALDGSGYMHPRWFSLNELASGNVNFKGSNQVLINKKVSEITEVAITPPLTLFNGSEGDGTNAAFKLPNLNLRTSSRYKESTRLAKVITSNSAKLPPIGRLNPQFADKLCANYFVQVGIANDNGSFLADSPVQAKRSLRRNESITASMWPDHYNETQIEDLETTSNSGSCNTGLKNAPSEGIGRGNLMSNRIAINTPNLFDIPLLTGSSPFNGPNSSLTTHSQNCISRFGIQDMIGNQSETNSEQIFCDYTQDQIRLGPVSGQWQGGATITNADKTPDESEPNVVHFPFFNTNDQRDHWAVAGNFQFKYRDGITAPRSADIKPWVKISVNSGYCSLVDTNPEKRIGDDDFFKDVSTGFWTSIKLANGAVNPTIIERTQPDQMAVNEWRNGDGRFLDFGPQGISPALNRAQTLDIRSITAGSAGTGKYFNPLIGLPLKCSSGSCNDNMLTNGNDNTSITTTTLNGNVDPDSAVNDIPIMTNFPIGNSQISSPGISDFRFPASGIEEYTVPASGGLNNAPFDTLLTAVTFDAPGSLNGASMESKQISEFSPSETIQYYRVVWDVPRDTAFRMNYGGSSKNVYSGRYTSSFTNEYPNTNFNGYGTTDVNSGARCSVMINQEP